MTSIEAWMYKANNDLKSALKLLEGDDPIMDTAFIILNSVQKKL